MARGWTVLERGEEELGLLRWETATDVELIKQVIKI